MYRTPANADVPNIERKQYQLLDITDNGFLSLKGVDGSIRDDVKVPEGKVGTDIEQLFGTNKEDIHVQILSAMGEEKVIGVARDSPPADAHDDPAMPASG